MGKLRWSFIKEDVRQVCMWANAQQDGCSQREAVMQLRTKFQQRKCLLTLTLPVSPRQVLGPLLECFQALPSLIAHALLLQSLRQEHLNLPMVDLNLMKL